jgi:C-terminal processing protease CtpA/Prc
VTSIEEITEARVTEVTARPRRSPAFAVCPEPKAGSASFPTREERLTGFIRLWNVVHYFFAYHDLTDRPWSDVLDEYAPRVADADNEDAYVRVVAEACTHLRDSHVGVQGAAAAEALGSHVPAVGVDFIEGRAVVTAVSEGSELQPGDVIEAVDGKQLAEILEVCRASFSASSEEAHNHQVARRWMLVGPKDTDLELNVETVTGRRDVVLRRDQPWFVERDRHRAPGLDTFATLPSGVGYIDLVDLLPEDVDRAMTAIEKTPAVVLDLRGYPNGIFPILAPRFARARTRAALFRRPDVHAPIEGNFSDCIGETWSSQWVEPKSNTYGGRVAVLIDMNAISQSEHTALWLEAACDPVFIGSPTRGANGNITAVGLPGRLAVRFTGLDTRHGDGSQLQRVGIKPHVTVRPTVEGIRERRDEVLDAAVEHLLGLL